LITGTISRSTGAISFAWAMNAGASREDRTERDQQLAERLRQNRQDRSQSSHQLPQERGERVNEIRDQAGDHRQ
jgi:membrane protein involved in colicin uptake